MVEQCHGGTAAAVVGGSESRTLAAGYWSPRIGDVILKNDPPTHNGESQPAVCCPPACSGRRSTCKPSHQSLYGGTENSTMPSAALKSPAPPRAEPHNNAPVASLGITLRGAKLPATSVARLHYSCDMVRVSKVTATTEAQWASVCGIQHDAQV